MACASAVSRLRLVRVRDRGVGAYAVEVERLAGPEQVHDAAHRSREEFGQTGVVGREGVDLQPNDWVADVQSAAANAYYVGWLLSRRNLLMRF
jgi:hypothetical protein